MILTQKLRERGWYLTDDGMKKLAIINNLDTEDVNKIISIALNCDFKDIAAGALPSKLDSNGSIRGRIVLQIQKMRNISAPKANEESTAAPRFLQLELSDGVNTIPALEFERIANLNLSVPPGTKLFIKSEKITLLNGFIVLKATDVQVLGGNVESLVEKWELARQMLKYARNNRRLSGSSGPPPWIAFGKRLDVDKDAIHTEKNFKSLQISNERDKNSKENDEFNATRTQAIAEATKAGQKKIFGGGQQNILDHNVKKILEKGYSEEDAKQALKINNNNLERALYNLKRKNNIIFSSENAVKSGIVPTARIRDKGGVSSAKEEAAAGKRQTNVSLFDFLTDKLPTSVSTETVISSAKKDRYIKGENSLKNNNTKPSNSGGNKFENNMSSSFAANRATTSTKCEEGRIIHNLNRKQDENLQINNKSGKGGERNNINRAKVQVPNIKIQNKISAQEENLNPTGVYNKRNERLFKNENNQRQPPINDFSANRRPNVNKATEKKALFPRDLSRNNQDSNNKNNYQQKSIKKSNTFENDLLNLVKCTSKLTTQNKKDSIASTQQNSSRNIQYISNSCINQQTLDQSKKSEYSSNSSLQKASKCNDSQNITSKSIKQNTKLSVYRPQLGNGFAYDQSKIVGFQSKEANEYAISMLKSQGVTLQQVQQQQTASLQAQQATQIQSPPPQLPQNPVLNSQTPTSVTYITPNANMYLTQSHQSPQFGLLSDGNWLWKEGDLCLAKYWDDGNFYNAKITAISEKTCVVLFLEYGNHEEVLKSDCVPITDSQQLSLAPFQTSIAVRSISQIPQQAAQHRLNINSGINCGGNQRYRSERQMYIPPPKRTNN